MSVERTENGARPPCGPGREPLSPQRAKVLIVDDDERNAFAAIEALSSLGVDLVVARSGAEALRTLLQDEFAVILLDLHMPGMDGYEVARLIRSRARTRRTPIVFLTAIFRDEQHVFQAYEVGAVDLVFKPVDPFVLRSKVAVLVDLYMKTEEVRQLALHQQQLLADNARIQAEKARAERALRRSEAQQQAILQSLPIVFHARAVEPPFTPLYVSESVEAITGFAPQRFLEQGDFGASRIHPDDLQRMVQAVSAATRTGSYACEYRWLRADGQYRYLMDQGVLAPPDESGEPQIFGVILDATDRRLLEQQLTQARKMEAVGQLTGGVAHDFNNLLSVVLGNIDIMGRRAEDEAKRARRIDAIRQAAERGRDLTRQLLAFSRRQKLSPRPVELGQLIRGFAPLLRQAVGDAVTVRLKLSRRPLWALVDATQLETALLNLAVNARDAMPTGGDLNVSTGFFKLGTAGTQGVRIVVSDTGGGMTPEVRERVFEPFFTTKEVGRGSGLGLSQVHGFVIQSGGEIRVSSQPGAGTSFELVFPVSEPAEIEPEIFSEPASVEGGSERVLVVEDDRAVLSVTVEFLQGLGYQVVTAQTAADALAVLKADPGVDLMFSDVIMPGGMDGIGLARLAQAERPDLQVLLTSGFTGDRALATTPDYPILDKPYDNADLARKLRALLAAASPRRADRRSYPGEPDGPKAARAGG